MKPAVFLLLLCVAFGAEANEVWDALWHSADQRGQALLNQGDAAAAARTFNDPRRKAFAAAQAGDFATAARHLASIDDRDAQYNRGNALAHAGDLKGALAAYDAALAHDPKDADARHNRDLVAQALKQQPPPPPRQGKGGGQPKPSGPQASGAEKKGSDKGEDKGNGAPSKDADASGKPGDSGQPRDAKGDSGAASSPSGTQPDASSGQRGTGPQAPEKDDAAQARRDAQASVGQGASAPAGAGGDALSAARAASAPRSEQQLAEDQWLRRIPDDPGGLLRRKFMIEHMMRQKQEDKP